jgi:excisionase family DNA binding protein
LGKSTPATPVTPVGVENAVSDLVLIPLGDRWLALSAEELRAAQERAARMGFGASATPAPPPVAEERLLTSQEMSDRLGVPDTWVEQAAKDARVPSVRVGRYLRFNATQVLAALQANGHADRRSSTHA